MTPSIAAIVGVKDEHELILGVVEHLESIGVTEIVLYDDCSTDGTELIAQALVDQGRVKLVQQNVLEISGEEDLAIYHQMIRACRSEWVMSIDADEFPLVACGDLRRCEELTCGRWDAITLPRRNVILNGAGLTMQIPPTRQALSDIQIVAQPVRNFWADPQLAQQIPWIRSAIMPKMIGRREVIERVADGQHDFGGATEHRRTRASSLFVAHAPLTTWERFETKVNNICTLVDAKPHEFVGQGMHWVRWVNIHRSAGLRQEFDWQIMSPAEVQTLTHQGVVTSAESFLRSLASDPHHPA